MSDKNKLAILNFLSTNAVPATPTRISFNSISKTLALPKEELDNLLIQLNRERFISQYVKKGVDSFMVVLNQKGIDAVEDESFI